MPIPEEPEKSLDGPIDVTVAHYPKASGLILPWSALKCAAYDETADTFAARIASNLSSKLGQDLFASTVTAGQKSSSLNFEILNKMLEDLPPTLREIIMWDRAECYVVTMGKVQRMLAPKDWEAYINSLFRYVSRETYAFDGIHIEYDNERAERIFGEAKKCG